eukprot:5585633-Amphidinium_carterae.1
MSIKTGRMTLTSACIVCSPSSGTKRLEICPASTLFVARASYLMIALRPKLSKIRASREHVSLVTVMVCAPRENPLCGVVIWSTFCYVCYVFVLIANSPWNKMQ